MHDIIEVKINGAHAGTLWRAPYPADVTDAVRKGINPLEVAVINSSFNRKVGDAHPGATKIASIRPASAAKVTATTPLLPVGLMGPVRVYNEKQRQMPGDQELGEATAEAPRTHLLIVGAPSESPMRATVSLRQSPGAPVDPHELNLSIS